jgi:hypothetical protein
MPLHSVRLDDEAEQALERVCDATGASASEVLKNGVLILAEALRRRPAPRPFDLYRTLDLGPGGPPRARARQAKRLVRELLLRKRRG